MRLSFSEDLEDLKDDLEKFSITLFGRTMAGKSTLMEVLTEGDGSAIGMGTQRTTRDIRSYEWNGLSVTDVPGIGAFEGEEDTRLAFDAAKTADLIVFLLTDDAPQAVEADCFRQVKDLGKPVIVIMNVKVSIDAGKSRKLIERDMKRAFDLDRIEEIRKQFCRFAEPYGQDWTSVPFVYVHLKSAYEAVKCAKSDDEDIRYQAEFWRSVSHIDDLKSFICEEVMVRGRYIRVKTFADIISNPMIEVLSELDWQSRMNESQGRIIADKIHALEKQKSVFVKSGRKRIESFMMRLKTEFRADIAGFAEDHYQDKMADIKWGELVKSKDLEGRCRVFLDEMESEVDGIIEETIREMTSELRYVSVDTLERSFLMPALVDARGIIRWTGFILGSGGTIASVILTMVGGGAAAAAGPVGWIASAIGFTGMVGLYLFETRGDKHARARAKLEEELGKSVNSTCDSIWTQLEKNMDRLVKGKIDLVLSELTKFGNVIDSLALTQSSLASSLRTEIRSLNLTFIQEISNAVFDKGSASEYMSKINTAVRIPGVCTLLLEGSSGAVDPEFASKMKELISEDVGIITVSSNDPLLVSDILGGIVKPEDISIDEERGMAVIKVSEKDNMLYNRLRLLEQIRPYRIGG